MADELTTEQIEATAQPIEQSTPEDIKSLVESLRPSNLKTAETMREEAAITQRQELQTEEPPATTEKAPTPPVRQDNQAYNAGQLRKMKEAAERERDELKRERDELKAKLGDVDILTKEREDYRSKLTAAEEQAKSTRERLFALSARETPEWQEKTNLINSAEAEIADILNLPDVKDYHQISVKDLQTPENLNNALRALHEAGKYAEADTLKDALRARSIWSRDRDTLEQASAAKAKDWETNKAARTQGRIAQTRQDLVAKQPHLVPGTPEFQKLPATAQEDIQASWAEAQKNATELIKADPDVQIDRFLATNLAMQLESRKGQRMNAAIQELAKERDDLKSRLEAYESRSARPAASVGSGSNSGGKMSLQDEIERLKPANLR